MNDYVELKGKNMIRRMMLNRRCIRSEVVSLKFLRNLDSELGMSRRDHAKMTSSC